MLQQGLSEGCPRRPTTHRLDGPSAKEGGGVDSAETVEDEFTQLTQAKEDAGDGRRDDTRQNVGLYNHSERIQVCQVFARGL